MVNWVGLAIPFAYLAILVGSLATFSSLYRKRKAVKASSLAPWFPPHLQRNIYLTLVDYQPPAAGPNDKRAPPVPDSVLKAALLRRATEDISRIIAIRGQKQALASLLQRGSVGDDLWQRFLIAEKEIEAEVKDVVQEANEYAPGWGQTIFQSANEVANNAILRKRIEEHQTRLQEEQAWWDRKRANIQEDFMKELDAPSAITRTALPVSDASIHPAASSKSVTSAIAGEKDISDDEAILVESGLPSGSGVAKSGKKKKGKKVI